MITLQCTVTLSLSIRKYEDRPCGLDSRQKCVHDRGNMNWVIGVTVHCSSNHIQSRRSQHAYFPKPVREYTVKTCSSLQSEWMAPWLRGYDRNLENNYFRISSDTQLINNNERTLLNKGLRSLEGNRCWTIFDAAIVVQMAMTAN